MVLESIILGIVSAIIGGVIIVIIQSDQDDLNNKKCNDCNVSTQLDKRYSYLFDPSASHLAE